MTDIRLNKISIEKNTLSIDKGNIIIKNTESSINFTNASLILNGGLTIMNTSNSSSFTSGGAMTVLGGMSIYKNANYGDNVYIHNNNNVLDVKGITNSRFFVDTTNNENIYFSPNGLDKRLVLNNSSLSINYTSSNGIISDSGIYIKNTTNTTFINNELTALTVLGGVCINKDIYVDNNMKVNNIIYVNKDINVNENININKSIIFNTINNIYSSNNNLITTIQNDIIFNTSNGNFIFNQNNENILDINQNNTYHYNNLLNYRNIEILSTEDSINSSTGSLQISGGVYIEKNLINNKKIYVNTNNSDNNKIILYENGEYNTAIGNSLGNFIISLDDNNLSSFNILSTYGNLLKINQDGDILFKGSIDNYMLKGMNNEINLLSYSSIGNILSLTSVTQNNLTQFKLYYKSLPSDISSQFLTLYTLNDNSYISTNKSGNGTLQNLNINIGDSNYMIFTTHNNIIINTSMSSINSSMGSLIMYGGLSINNTSNSTSFTEGGALTVNGGVSINKDMYINGIINIKEYIINGQNGLNITTNKITDTNIDITNTKNMDILYNNLINIYNYNSNTNGSYEYMQLGYTNENYIIGINNTRTLNINNNINEIILNTNGIIINGNTQINNNLEVTNNINSNNIESEMIIINSTDISLNSSSGSIISKGGVYIDKNLIVNDTILINSTNISNSITSGSLILKGGLSIQATENSINVNNGGGLTVAGGASIFGDLYVGGTINGGTNSVNIVSQLEVTSTKESINSTTGAILSYGGVSIDASYNSASITQGGALTVNGGMSVKKDMYIGNNINIYDAIKYNTIGTILNINQNEYTLDFTNNNLLINSSNNNILTINNTSTSIYTALYNYNNVINYLDVDIQQKLQVRGDVTLNSTTISTNFTTGSVLIKGGIGLDGNINMKGNMSIIGDLMVLGTISNIYSENLNISDNIILLNSAPNGSKNSGFLINRYQTNNDSGLGDVVNDNDFISDNLPSQSGLNLNQIRLPNVYSGIDDIYKGYWIKITSGFNFNQTRYIINYNGTTKIATLETNFTTQNPVLGDTFNLYYKNFTGLIYNELNDIFEFGNTNLDTLPINSYADLALDNIIIKSSKNSINSTTGSLVNYGGISIANTSNAISITQGGSLTTEGGVSIRKKLIVGENLEVNNIDLTPNIYDIYVPITFNALNNQNNPQNITNLVYNNMIFAAEIFLYAELNTLTNSYSSYHIRILNKGTVWDITQEYIGDNLNINFYIDNNGQIQYTTPNYNNFVSLKFVYKTNTIY